MISIVRGQPGDVKNKMLSFRNERNFIHPETLVSSVHLKTQQLERL